MKKAFRIISSVLVWALVVATVGIMIFTIVSVNTFDQSNRSIFGYKMFIVTSDSMSATDFDAGDLIFVKNVDPATLKEGDIIAFVSQSSNNFGETVTHKIRKIVTDAYGQPAFITYGTTTNTDDDTPVGFPYVLGKYTGNLSKVGYFFNFLKTTTGYIVCIFIPFLLLILYQVFNCVQLFRKYRKEQLDEIRAEREQIEEERRQAAEMMKELQALKAQLAEQQSEQKASSDSETNA